MQEIKLFAATFLSGGASALTEKEQTVFARGQPLTKHAPFQGAQKGALDLRAAHPRGDPEGLVFYVRVPSGKQFYLYVLQTIDRNDAIIGGSLKPFANGEGADLSTPNSTPPFQP